MGQQGEERRQTKSGANPVVKSLIAITTNLSDI
jgi:hypothetical protein